MTQIPIRVSRFLSRLLLPAAIAVIAFVPVQADEPAPNEHTARHEVDFMQHAIDHHLYGIRMTELCTQRATSPELIELCTTMLASHRTERDQLQAWLENWYDEPHDAHLAESQHALLAELGLLNNGEFERSYLKQMIPHHMVGIQDAAKCAVQFHHEALLDACTASIAMQAEEIRTMREMLCDSYGVCSLELRENLITDQPMEGSMDGNDGTPGDGVAPEDSDGNGEEDGNDDDGNDGM